jgi:hypothetical protein
MKVVFSNTWDFLAPFVKIFLSSAGVILAEIAIKTVTNIALTMADADGDAKRKEAVKQIQAELISRGIVLGVSVVNSAIEAAVQRIKTQ